MIESVLKEMSPIQVECVFFPLYNICLTHFIVELCYRPHHFIHSAIKFVFHSFVHSSNMYMILAMRQVELSPDSIGILNK